jgi:hypothetical protein
MQSHNPLSSSTSTLFTQQRASEQYIPNKPATSCLTDSSVDDIYFEEAIEYSSEEDLKKMIESLVTFSTQQLRLSALGNDPSNFPLTLYNSLVELLKEHTSIQYISFINFKDLDLNLKDKLSCALNINILKAQTHPPRLRS